MKVLVVSEQIFLENHPNYQQMKTGLAVFMNSFAKVLSQETEMFILVPSAESDEMPIGNGMLVCQNNGIIIKSVTPKSLLTAGICFSELFKIKNKSNYIKQKLFPSYFEKVIKQIEPDIIHFHDISPMNFSCIQYCRSHGLKYLITLHLFIGNKEIQNYEDLRKVENKLFSTVGENEVFTVISSGMKRKLLSTYPNLKDEQVVTIPDGIPELKKQDVNLQKTSRKIMLCIGTICERKNQLEVLAAYQKLPQKIKAGLELHFVGKDALNGLLQKKIKDEFLELDVKYLGELKPEQMFALYQNADYVIVASKDEGFGLTMVEGFYYGLPTVTYSDIDAFHEIYSEDAVIGVEQRGVEYLANGIAQAYEKTWDKEKVIAHGKKFSMRECVSKYCQVYKKIGGEV